MKGRGLRYRTKTDEELIGEYQAEGLAFDKRLKAVLPHQTAMAQGILTLKQIRDFALHGAVVQWGSAEGETDGIVHVDAPATIFSQGSFMSRPLETVIPKGGHAEAGREAGASGAHDGWPAPRVRQVGGIRLRTAVVQNDSPSQGGGGDPLRGVGRRSA